MHFPSYQAQQSFEVFRVTVSHVSWSACELIYWERDIDPTILFCKVAAFV